MNRHTVFLCLVALTFVACGPDDSPSRGRQPRPLYDAPARPDARPAREKAKAPAASADNCDKNYDPCIEKGDDDVDCGDGRGNGPRYAPPGPIRIIGNEDPYDLDSNGDGIACEPPPRPKAKYGRRG